jgi:lipid-A-disaccharide synthase
MIIAGEVSGDMHAAALLREFRRICPRPVEAYGIGGDQLAADGVELFAHADQTGVIGFWEVAKRFRFFRGLLRRMAAVLDTRRPDLLLTVDYPGFNMRLAAQAKSRGIRTVHYVCPQVWAWHRERIPKIAAIFDRLITIFPFEPALFDGTGLDVVFAGHPLVDRAAETRTEPPPALPWGPGHRVALFPGSRPGEVQRLLPDLVAAACEVERRIGPCTFLVPTPTEAIALHVERVLAGLRAKPAHIAIARGNSRHVLLQAAAAVVKSGTGTLEASLLLCPAVIVYRTSTLSYLLFKRLITGVRHIGLVNIIADREVCRELLQDDLTPTALADELVRLLDDPVARDAVLDGMRAVNVALGGDGAAARAARAVLDVLPVG